MPAKTAHDVSSDLSPAWANTLFFNVELPATGTASGNRATNFAAGQVKSAAYITPAGVPNNDAWEDGGTEIAELDITTGNMDLRARCRVVKLSSTGVIIESGNFTGFQTLNVSTRSFSPVSPTWAGSEDCDNRYAIEWEFESTNTMGMVLSLTITLNTTDSEVFTTISENSAGCVVAANLESDSGYEVG